MNQKLSARQLHAFCFSALTAPAVTVCAGLPWQWVLAVSLIVCALETVMVLLWGRCGARHLPVVMTEVWGPRAGKALLALTGLYTAAVLWRLGGGMLAAFPDDRPSPFAPLVLLAVSAWACAQGRAAVIRASAVLFFFLTAAYGIITIFALPDAEPARLLRAPEETQNLFAMAVLLVPTFALYLARGGVERKKIAPGWLLCYLLFPPAVAALTAVVPGSDGSFYQMAKSVEVLSVAQRIEPLVSAVLMVGWFAVTTLLALTVGEIASSLGGNRKLFSVLACGAAIPGAIWKNVIPDATFAVAAAVFSVFLPLTTLLVDAAKKLEKKRK